MPKSKPKLAFSLETEWIRGYAKSYLPNEAGFSFPPRMLRERNISIIQIRHALRHGAVVYADKLDEPGAEWIVVGKDQDGNELRFNLVVVSEAHKVTMRDVTRIEDLKETNDDAA